MILWYQIDAAGFYGNIGCRILWDHIVLPDFMGILAAGFYDIN